MQQSLVPFLEGGTMRSNQKKLPERLVAAVFGKAGESVLQVFDEMIPSTQPWRSTGVYAVR